MFEDIKILIANGDESTIQNIIEKMSELIEFGWQRLEELDENNI